MGKLSLTELTTTKLSEKLVQAANSVKGGAESACHPGCEFISCAVSMRD